MDQVCSAAGRIAADCSSRAAAAIASAGGHLQPHRPSPACCLQLVTNPGADYYVKLVDPETKSDRFGIYVHGGHSLDVDVPLGQYEVHYAAGETWYGISRRFGQDTVYFRADRLFNFTATSDGYSGYTIELILQPNGNLTSTQIPAADF